MRKSILTDDQVEHMIADHQHRAELSYCPPVIRETHLVRIGILQELLDRRREEAPMRAAVENLVNIFRDYQKKGFTWDRWVKAMAALLAAAGA